VRQAGAGVPQAGAVVPRRQEPRCRAARTTWVSSAFVAYRKRRPRPRRLRLVLAPVLGLTAALAAAGCTTASSGTASTSTPRASSSGVTAASSGAAPAITQARARQVFDAYVAAAAKAAQASDKPLALSVVTGVQRAVLAAALGSHAVDIPGASSTAADGASGSTSGGAYYSGLLIALGYPQESYGPPVFYLPQAGGYPRFFAASVTQTAKGTTPGRHPVTVIGGATVPADGTALMLFEQARAGASWLLASTSDLAAGEALPRLAAGSAGYLPVVTPSAAALLAPPDSVGALQAAVVDDGPASAAARAVAAGPLTTGLYAAARDHADGLRAPAGDVYQWELEGSPLPEFALRTADGGALAFYAMSLDETVAVPGEIGKADPVRSGPPIQIPDDLLPLLPPGQQDPLIQLQAQQTLSFAAVDPPSSASKITVIAVGGGLTFAAAT
jgi:hypothetical protein